MKKLSLALVSFAFLGMGQVAAADEYAISYSAKELQSAAGVQSVHKRIVKMAKQYCPTYSQIRNNKEVKACVSDVVADLVEKVDHPRLSSYHQGDSSLRLAVAETAGE